MLQPSFEGFFKGVNGFMGPWFLLFPGDKEQKRQENENPIEGDDTFEPLLVVENIPKREDKNEEGKENNSEKRDGPTSNQGHWARLRIPYHARSMITIKMMREAVRYAQFASSRS